MTNKFNVDRQRLFRAGYNRYLRSLSHGALVDFILNGADLSFDNQQERDLLLAEVADQKGRHDRATAKINELVLVNRDLNEALGKTRPVDTSSAFQALQRDERVEVIDVSACNTIDDFMDALFGRCTCADEEPITTIEEFVAIHPLAVALAVTSAVTGVPLPDETIRLCAVLEEEFAPFIVVNPLFVGLLSVSVVFTDITALKAFKTRAAELGVTGIEFGFYVVNHSN